MVGKASLTLSDRLRNPNSKAKDDMGDLCKGPDGSRGDSPYT